MQKLYVLTLILIAALAITLTGCNNKNGGGSNASVQNPEECPGGVCALPTSDAEDSEVEDGEDDDTDIEDGEEEGEEEEDSEVEEDEEEDAGCACAGCGSIQISFDDGKTYLLEFNADKMTELGLTPREVLQAMMKASESAACKNVEELSALVLTIGDQTVKVSDIVTFTEQ
ncbi:MAG: hypothetical protein WC712_13670 [Candidatus Brocadiia bacterium]